MFCFPTGKTNYNELPQYVNILWSIHVWLMTYGYSHHLTGLWTFFHIDIWTSRSLTCLLNWFLFFYPKGQQNGIFLNWESANNFKFIFWYILDFNYISKNNKLEKHSFFMFNVHVSHCTQTNMNYNEHVVVLVFFLWKRRWYACICYNIHTFFFFTSFSIMTKIQINYLSTNKTSIFMYSLVVMFSILATKLGWVARG